MYGLIVLPAQSILGSVPVFIICDERLGFAQGFTQVSYLNLFIFSALLFYLILSFTYCTFLNFYSFSSWNIESVSVSSGKKSIHGEQFSWFQIYFPDLSFTPLCDPEAILYNGFS